MIVIHIDTQKDTNFLTKCYEGIEDAKVLVNPTRKEVDKVLTENPTDKVMMLGHGCGGGLFGADFKENAIDYKNAHLLKGRDCIGIWCYAKNFARNYGLKGYFTSMFISNGGEAKSFGYKDATEEDVFAEVAVFAERVNTLIKNETPLDEWVEKLQEQADYTKNFVEFNYNAMEYFDGTQKPTTYGYYGSYGSYGSYASGATKGKSAYYADYDVDDELDLWFEDYCKENGIDGDWAKDIARPIFEAGWKAHGDALDAF